MKSPLSPGLLRRMCRRRGHSEDGGREYRPAKRHLQGGETGFVMEIGLAGQQGQKRWPWEGLCADYF